MDIGDYYSRSFDDLKENLNIVIPSFVGMVLANLIMFIIFEFLEPQLFINEMITPEFHDMILTDVVIPSVLVTIVAVVINSFIYAATIGMAEKILKGQKPDLEVAWKSGRKYFIKILAVSIIMGLITAVLILPFILGLILINVFDILGLAVTVLGVVILIVGIILLSLAFMVVNQSIVIGKKSIIDSIKDGVNVFAKNKLEVFLVAVINLVIVAAIYFVITIVAIDIGFVLESPYVGLILHKVVEIILTPYLILVITYLYMDIKEKLPGQISVNNV
ncbi:MAG: hypothetical protein PQ964_03250 [Methanobacteriaceae archaeon]|jgi:hypothetical protein